MDTSIKSETKQRDPDPSVNGLWSQTQPYADGVTATAAPHPSCLCRDPLAPHVQVPHQNLTTEIMPNTKGLPCNSARTALQSPPAAVPSRALLELCKTWSALQRPLHYPNRNAKAAPNKQNPPATTDPQPSFAQAGNDSGSAAGVMQPKPSPNPSSHFTASQGCCTCRALHCTYLSAGEMMLSRSAQHQNWLF